MELNLQDLWLDTGIGVEVVQESTSHVGDTNVFSKSLINELFHGLPSFREGDLFGNDDSLLGINPPLGRITLRGVDIFEGDGEVDKEKIEVWT